jgi:hypothetical protein
MVLLIITAMVRWKTFFVGVCLLVAGQALAQSSSQAPAQGKPAVKDCEDLKIRYESMDPKFAARMIVDPGSNIDPRGSAKESPQGTRWMLAPSPDYSKAGPWTTSIYIGGEGEPTIKVTLRDHEGFTIEWLNEKLLYGTIAWSKTVNTDFIFDVEAQKFIYREMENSSDLGQDCE